MTSSPDDAYKAAKLRRDEKEHLKQAQPAAQQTLPDLAEERLQQIKTELETKTPPGLRLEVEFTSAGGMNHRTSGRRGVKGLYLKLFEGQDPRAEGSINIGSDESVELTDHTNGIPKQVIYKKATFASLNTELCLEFLSNLITKHIV